ncbi:MAG: glycosyltransferase family 2 protein [Bryobacterales bacterium]
MRLSVILCTIRRPDLVAQCIRSLERQTYQDFEVLVVGGPRQTYCSEELSSTRAIRCLTAPKGLARARNVGLAEAHGDIICFFDDDVVLSDDFLARTVAIFDDPGFADIVGLTGYDTHSYGMRIGWKWRLRRVLGVTRTLEAGASDHLGRNVPLNFAKPFDGYREVAWLPGFCQIFRAERIAGLLYDEESRAAEDRDFALAAGERGRMLMVGDLELAHHHDREARDSAASAVRRSSFALGRSFAKRRRSAVDWIAIGRNLFADVLIDSVVAAAKPSRATWQIVPNRVAGFVEGLQSLPPSVTRVNPASR